jgi:Tol biopolymer transport system component
MKNGPLLSPAVMLVAALFASFASAQERRPKVKLATSEVSLGRFISGGIEGTLTVSPDSSRLAYLAKRGDKWLVVVDGVERKEYDGIGKGSPLFSPDGMRVGYGAGRGGKQLVVVDGVEGKEYNGFLTGSRMVFDGPRSLHTLAVVGREFFRVHIEWR